MIVKLQRPIAGSDPGAMAMVLCYDEDRSFEKMMPMSQDMQDKIFGDAFKVYYDIEVVGGEVFKVNEQVEDQDW